ncbi:MAG: sensor histidine kinase [Planctomycetota bacterium]
MAHEEMIQMFAHDMRSIITAAVWHLRLQPDLGILSASPGSETPPRSVLRALAGLLEAADRLLCGARSSPKEPNLCVEEFDFHECASGVASLMSAQAMARGVKLGLRWLPDEVMVRCDRHIANRILVNLLGNAIKVSPVGETVLIAIEAGREEIRVEVFDRGPGIPPRARTTAFDLPPQGATAARALALLRRSMDASDMVSSSGLGLAFSRISVESLGGGIGVDDREGGGSVFWFTLPKPA